MSLPLCSPLPCHSQLLLLHWVACHCPRAAVLLAAVLRWKKGQSAAIRIAVKTWKSVQEKTKEYIIQQIRGIHIVRENTEKIQRKYKRWVRNSKHSKQNYTDSYYSNLCSLYIQTCETHLSFQWVFKHFSKHPHTPEMGDDEVTSLRKTRQERKNRVCPVAFDKPEILSLHVINSYYWLIDW